MGPRRAFFAEPPLPDEHDFCGGKGGKPGPCPTGAHDIPKGRARAAKPVHVKIKAATEKVAKINGRVQAAKATLDKHKLALKAAKADLKAVKATVATKAAKPDATAKPAAQKVEALVSGLVANAKAGKTTPSQDEIKAKIKETIGKASPREVAKALGIKTRQPNNAAALAAIQELHAGRVGAFQRSTV